MEKPSGTGNFDAWAADALARGDVAELAAYRHHAPGMPYAHPTVEHYTPLFVTLGAATTPDEPGLQVIDGFCWLHGTESTVDKTEAIWLRVNLSSGATDIFRTGVYGAAMSDAGPANMIEGLEIARLNDTQLWASFQAPYYPAGGSGVRGRNTWVCPKATLALVGQLEDVLEISIPLDDLPEESRAWERGVDELAEEDEEIGDYVRALEETRDTADLPEASGEAIAREFERYLKRRDSGDD